MATFETRKFLLNFLQSNPGQQFKSSDLAQKLIELHPVEAAERRSASSQDMSGNGLTLQIQAEISAQRKDLLRKYPEFSSTDTRPSLYSWIPVSHDSQTTGEPATTSNPFSEHSLYPKLQIYLEGLGVYARRIDEKTTNGRRGAGSNHWRHPDLVGFEYLPTGWEHITRSLGRHYQSSLLKFWSFEVKVALSISNVREAFFQTISNSSWANYAYLVTSALDAKAKDELELLSEVHGIGVMVLNPTEPLESLILLPAKERVSLDWGAIDVLVSENRDFSEFVKYSSLAAESGEVEIVKNNFNKSFL